MLIIVEGCQGSGKTTLTNFLRENIPYSQLFRLSGNRFSGNNEDLFKGELKSFLNHMAIADCLATIAYTENNAILDRSFLSEAVYSRMYRGGTFDKYLDDLVRKYESLKSLYNVVLIRLLVNPKNFDYRLNRDKAVFGVHKFDKEKSIQQQKVYYHLSNEYMGNFEIINLKDVDVDEEYFLQNLLECIDERF